MSLRGIIYIYSIFFFFESLQQNASFQATQDHMTCLDLSPSFATGCVNLDKLLNLFEPKSLSLLNMKNVYPSKRLL